MPIRRGGPRDGNVNTSCHNNNLRSNIWENDYWYLAQADTEK